MVKKLLLPVLCLVAFCLSAQQNNESLLKEVDELLFDSQFEKAIQLIDGSAISEIDSKIKLANRKAEALIGLGRLEEAAEELTQAASMCGQSKNEALMKGIIKATQGFRYLNEGRNDLALDELTEAANMLQQTGDALEAAKALSYLGQVYSATGKYVQGEEQLLMALSLRQDVLPENHELIAASYNNLGLVYSQLDIDKAIDYYDKAAAIYEAVHGKEHPKMAIANTNLGMAFLSLKLYGDATTYFEDALGIWEKIYPQPHPSKALVLTNLGRTASDLGDLNAALEYYNKALAMYIEAQGRKHPNVAYTFNLIGNILKTQDKFDEALARYQQALISNVPDFSSENITENPTGKDFYNGNVLLYSMMYKAQALEARHFGKTLKLTDLELGLQTLQSCDSLIDRLRQQTTNETDKIALGAIANEIYADGVRLAHALSELSFMNRKQFRELSFYFAEKSKSAVLLEAISDANAKSFAGIPQELLEEEKNLKSALALVNQKLAQKPTEDEEKYLRETAFHLNQSYQSFIQSLEKQYPEYYNLKFNPAAPTVHELQEILPSGTAMISYFADENNNRLYTYILTRKRFIIKEKRLPDEFDKNITGLRNSLYFMSDETFLQTGRYLHKLLIPTLPSSIKDLIILPTGRMSVIPFETLLSKNVNEVKHPGSYPYLVKRFSIRYEFSAGLVLQKKSSASTQVSSVLLFAPVQFPPDFKLVDLPGTEEEVRSIQLFFAEKAITCNVMLKQDATEAALKSDNLKNHNLIHLATHGLVDESNPEMSRIFLQSESEAEDGFLFSGEIYNLQLKAELVTLSACETGMGRISKGEGVIGLSRALVYAGAKNIMVSLWSVADESTAQLMTNFYQLLLENPETRYSDDLRQAKLKMMNGKYAAPFYWAPFILIGF